MARYPLGIITLFAILLIFGTTGNSVAADSATGSIGVGQVELDLSLAGGYRQDQLSWNIAGNYAGSDPTILSELTWDDLEILQLQAGARLNFGNTRRHGYLYHLRGMLGWGGIYEGENQDSDYAGDGRTLEFSRSNNNADDGDVFDFSAAAGLQFRNRTATLIFTPLLGYSYHEQNLTMSDGYQTLSDQAIANDFFGPGVVTLPPVGPFSGLDSSYDTEWYGPWLGFELGYRFAETWRLTGIVEHHWYDFEGRADWNLREDLAHPLSFKHLSDGTGLVFGLELTTELKDRWQCGLSFDYRDWEADPGVDIVYSASGSTSGTRLNEVKWESLAVMLALSRSF